MLVLFVQRFLVVVAVKVGRATCDDSFRGALEQDSVGLLALVTLDDGRHALALRAELKCGHGLHRLSKRVSVAHRVDLLVRIAYMVAVASEFLSKYFQCAFGWLANDLKALVFPLNGCPVVECADIGDVTEAL